MIASRFRFCLGLVLLSLVCTGCQSTYTSAGVKSGTKLVRDKDDKMELVRYVTLEEYQKMSEFDRKLWNAKVQTYFKASSSSPRRPGKTSIPASELNEALGK